MNKKGGAAGLVGMGCVGLLSTGMLALIMVMALLGGSSGSLTMPSLGGLSAQVPTDLVPWLQRSAAQCQPPLTPALLAAQLKAESNFDPKAQSPVGARGIAQIMPSNDYLIHDDDGNGTASAWDVGDAIMAQGRLMCSYVERLKAYEGEELTRYLLASYNAGPYAVLPSPCMAGTQGGRCQAKIPPYPETQAYVSKILGMIAQFEAPDTALGVVGQGGWVQPISGSYSVGGVFKQAGSYWRMCGWHTGYDYQAPIGTNVLAVHAGTVVHASWGSDAGGTGGAYGNQVIVDHGGGLRSYYDHLQAFAVTKGQKVSTGQVVGQLGVTGNTTGPHLHLEITTGTTGMPGCQNFVDPNSYIKKNAGPPARTGGGGDASDLGTAAVATARTQLGVPYVYGGGGLEGPDGGGWDCSSLVRYAWFQASDREIRLPRVTTDQIRATKEISRDELRAGDLVFFQTGLPGDWSHVGIYAGAGKMIHAPNPSTVVKEAPIDTGYYGQRMTAYRRVK